MKGSHSVSILQGKEKVCYLTGTTYNLHKHHIIFGTGYRAISDKNGLWVWLTGALHNQSKDGVHFNRELDLQLRRECQAKYEEEHSREEWIALTGRNYLDV